MKNPRYTRNERRTIALRLNALKNPARPAKIERAAVKRQLDRYMGARTSAR